MKRYFTAICFIFLVLNSYTAQGQCPKLYDMLINGTTSTSVCAPGTAKLSVKGVRLPSGGTLNWYRGDSPTFNPLNGEGVLLSTVNLAVQPAPGQCPAVCPDLLMLFMNSCDGSGSEPDNEFFVLNSGSGFFASDVQLDLDAANTSGNDANNNDINIGSNPCTIKIPDASLINQLRSGTCNNVNLIPAGPGAFIPSDAIVVFFTSSNVTINYNFSSFCETGRDVYVMQSSCTRTLGAFTNSISCASNRFRYQTFSLKNCPCSDELNYDRCGMSNLEGEYVRDVGQNISTVGNGGITRNAVDTCATPPYDQFAKADSTYFLDFTVNSNDPLCGQTVYFKAVVQPAGPTCTEAVTVATSLDIQCPDFSIVSVSDTICSGQPLEIVLSGGASSDYSWTVISPNGVSGISNGSITGTTITQTPILSGNSPVTLNYQISLDAGTCSTSPKSASVVVLPGVSAQITGPTILCNGQQDTLKVNTGSGTATWSTGATGNFIIINTGGTYWVKVDNGSCSDSAGIVVTVANQLNPFISGDTIICAGTSTILSVPAGFDSYSWSNGSNTNTTTVNNLGPISVTVTQGSCSGTSSVTVVQGTGLGTITETKTLPSCSGASDGKIEIANTFPATTTILWNTGETNFVLNGLSSGQYSATLSYLSCQSTVTYTLEDGPELLTQLNITPPSCNTNNTGSIQVISVSNSGTFPVEYSIDGINFQSANTFSGVASGNYTLNIRNSNGCSSDTVITVAPPLDLIAQLDISNAGCDSITNGSVEIIGVLNSTGNIQYALDGGSFQTDAIFDDLIPSAYTLSLIDDAGCKIDTVFNIGQSTPVVATLPDTLVLRSGTFLTITPLLSGTGEGTTYLWSPPTALSCIDCPTPIANPTSGIQYLLEVTNADECSDTATVWVEVLPSLSASLPSAFTPNNDGKNDEAFVMTLVEGTIIKKFEIFNRWGNKVFSVENVPAMQRSFGWDGTYNGKAAPMESYAYYFEVIWPEGGTYSAKGTILLVR